jgi:ankyrin repeat protein
VGVKTGCAARLWAILLVAPANLAVAAGADQRLVTAAAEQDRAAVRALLKERVDVNVARADGATALLFAAHWNDLDTVDLLLRAGANVNAADDHGVTPLARACENSSVAMVERLLNAGADPNAAQTSGLTPLMTAAMTGNVQVVKALLARSANVNAATTETKNTALMWAVASRHPAVVRVLIEGQADVHASTAKGFTPLLIAVRNGDLEMVKTLLAAGVDVNETGSDGTHVLPFAIVNGHADLALFLLEQGADPNGEMAGFRALHAAVTSVEPWLREWSLKHGAAGRSGRNLTPLQRPALVKALLSRRADPDARITTSTVFEAHLAYPWKGAFEPYSCGTGDLAGATPLWLAAHAANGGTGEMGGSDSATSRADTSVEIMRTLLAAGANHTLTSHDGTTPLMVAAGLGRCTKDYTLQRGKRSPTAEKAVTDLLDAGADINAVNEADFTALHGAGFRGLNEVVQILVERGGNIDARDFRGRTPYRLAEGSKQSFYFQGYPQTAELMKTLGANASMGLPGTVQERLRDVPAANTSQQPQ